MDTSVVITVNSFDKGYESDKRGYFKFYVNHYTKEIYVLFFSNSNTLLNTLKGNNAEALSKKVLELNLTTNLQHINYLGRELNKAELCLLTGKPYIQDE
ncbi:MAG: DUF4346 domain-containing protein [Promethearchaeota archaeon]